jgi:hypothetical protein
MFAGHKSPANTGLPDGTAKLVVLNFPGLKFHLCLMRCPIYDFDYHGDSRFDRRQQRRVANPWVKDRGQ